MAQAPNYKMVSAANKEKLKGILKWARTQEHPFTECKAALTKRGIAPDRADKICAVMKDMALGTTKWRGK